MPLLGRRVWAERRNILHTACILLNTKHVLNLILSIAKAITGICCPMERERCVHNNIRCTADTTNCRESFPFRFYVEITSVFFFIHGHSVNVIHRLILRKDTMQCYYFVRLFFSTFLSKWVTLTFFQFIKISIKRNV